MEPRRYYVIAPSPGEYGPYTLEEMREALERGMIQRHFQVRTGLGTVLGNVESLLAAGGLPAADRHHPGRASATRGGMESGTRRILQFNKLSLVAAIISLLLAGAMAAALRPGKSTAPLVPTTQAAVPMAQSAAPVVSAGAPAANPALGAHLGSVRSILSDGDLMVALGSTHRGEPNHKIDIPHEEIVRNAFDGKLDTKYNNGSRDGVLNAGVNSGFAIVPQRAEVVTAFQFATANDVEDRDPLGITIEGSNAEGAVQDAGKGYVLIYDGPSGLEHDPGRRQWGPCVVFANTTVYHTYRVLVTRTRGSTGGCTKYSEFRLGTFAAPAAGAAIRPTLGEQNGTVRSILSAGNAIIALGLTHRGGPNHQVDIPNSEVARNAFDSLVDSKYNNAFRDGALPCGINTGFAIMPQQAEVVTAFQFATANDREGRDPLSITIEGSNAEGAGRDQGTGFFPIYDGPSGLERDPGRRQWGPCVVFANTAVYHTYRVLVTKTRDRESDSTQYSEFRLGSFAPTGAAP